jgi:hypothetical protein
MMNVEQRDGYVLVRVRVQPKAAHDAVRIEADGRIRIALTAPPVDGAANAALCAFIARLLRLPKRAVSVESGEKSRDKALRVDGGQAGAIGETLQAACG